MTHKLDVLLDFVRPQREDIFLGLPTAAEAKVAQLRSAGILNSGLGLAAVYAPYSLAFERILEAWSEAADRLAASVVTSIGIASVLKYIEQHVNADAKGLFEQGKRLAQKHEPVSGIHDPSGNWRWFEHRQSTSLRQIEATLRLRVLGTDEPVESLQQEASNEFQAGGGIWTVTFMGSTETVVDLKGMLYLSYLLSHPGEEIPALRLGQLVEPERESLPADAPIQLDGETIDPSQVPSVDLPDSRAMKEYERKLLELKQNRDEAGEHERVRIDQDMELLEKELGKAGLTGRGRKDDTPNRKEARRIGRLITRARARIRSANLEALDDHLEAYLTTGDRFQYSPPTDPGWITD